MVKCLYCGVEQVLEDDEELSFETDVEIPPELHDFVYCYSCHDKVFKSEPNIESVVCKIRARVATLASEGTIEEYKVVRQ